jgi:hypothetical protein
VCLKSNHYELKNLRDVSAYGPIGPSALYFSSYPELGLRTP